MTLRIAMWSGPRNISTAMMRSWENRADTCVVDEPFYACYLQQTQLKHPCYQAVLQSQSTDWSEVIEQLTEAPIQNEIFYQKHMTHHMLSEVSLEWTKKLQHVFLIRNPRQVIASYIKAMPSVNQEDIGIIRQHELYRTLSGITGQDIPIIDSMDVLSNPRKLLNALCQSLSIPFDEGMLHWPSGKRTTDGVWASHWYENVERSTGFHSPKTNDTPDLSPELEGLANEAMPFYQELYERRIIAN